MGIAATALLALLLAAVLGRYSAARHLYGREQEYYRWWAFVMLSVGLVLMLSAVWLEVLIS